MSVIVMYKGVSAVILLQICNLQKPIQFLYFSLSVLSNAVVKTFRA